MQLYYLWVFEFLNSNCVLFPPDLRVQEPEPEPEPVDSVPGAGPRALLGKGQQF